MIPVDKIGVIAAIGPSKGLIAALGFGILCAGCAGGLSQDVAKLKSDIQDVRSQQASQAVDLGNIRTELNTIQGKIEELQFRLQGKTAEIEQSLVRLGSRVPPPPGVPEDLLQADEDAISRIANPESERFVAGLRSLRAGSFEEAARVFGEFVEKNPDTAFTDNALFWTGVSYERMNQCDRAVVSYSDVFRRFPGEDRVPAALYRLGECFVTLGSVSDATITFQKLIDEHPRSKEATQARARLGTLRRGRK